MKTVRRPLICILTCLALAVAGCKTTPETADVKHPAATPKKKAAPENNMPDQNGDQAFQAFLGRLRLAVRAHDVETIASMMTVDFGYKYPDGEGKGVFEYWDQNNVWPELELLIKERFVPHGENYMVAPAEFARDPETYTGYRAGLRLENGSWKFAYFVTG